MNQQQKNELLEICQQHAALDMLVAGSYGNHVDDLSEFRGCSIGCIAAEHGVFNDHHEYIAKHYDIPEWLVRMQDFLFENIGTKVHTELVAAIKPRDDWKPVMHAIHWRILTEITLPHAGDAADAVKAVADLHKANEPAESAAWSAARSAAESAAESAARSAAESAAWSAARSAAESAAWSAARSAAESAARSAARSAAESAAWSAAESAAVKNIYQIVLDEVAK